MKKMSHFIQASNKKMSHFMHVPHKKMSHFHPMCDKLSGPLNHYAPSPKDGCALVTNDARMDAAALSRREEPPQLRFK